MENKRTIVIIATLDVIGILANDSLKGNIYIFDNNKLMGSSEEGTENLKTKIIFNKNEEVSLVWNVMSLECESFASISQITADKEYILIEKKQYPSSDVNYWIGTIKKPFNNLKYKLSFLVGNTDMEYSCDLNIIGELAKHNG